MTPRPSTLPKARPPTQQKLDSSAFSAQHNQRILNTTPATSGKGKQRAFPEHELERATPRSRAGVPASVSSSAAGSSRSLAGRTNKTKAVEGRQATALSFSSSSPPNSTTQEMQGESQRRRKRQTLELDLVPEPDHEGFGGAAPSTAVHYSGSKRPRHMLDLVSASQSSDSPPLDPQGSPPPQWPEETPEPRTLDAEEGFGLPSVSTVNYLEDEQLVQAALVPRRGRKVVAHASTILVPDSDEEEDAPLDAREEVRVVEVPDSDEDDVEFVELARRTGPDPDDSGFAELECSDESSAFRNEVLYNLDANPTAVLGKSFPNIEESFFGPTLPTTRTADVALLSEPATSSSSPHSLGRSESGVLMPPPPFPTTKRRRETSQPTSFPRVLVEDTQSQAERLAAQAHSPSFVSRVLAGETPPPPTPQKRFGVALEDAWAGQRAPEIRQARLGEFFSVLPRLSASQDEEVVEDSQREPSLGEQVTALAMMRDVREGRRRREAEKVKSSAVLTGGAEEEDIEEADEVEELPSSQPRADECGVGLSPLKTPRADRVFRTPKTWPLSPSKRGGVDEYAVEEEEGVETQWESYWTLASPSASLVAEYRDV